MNSSLTTLAPIKSNQPASEAAQLAGRTFLQLDKKNIRLIQSLSTPDGKKFLTWSCMHVSIWAGLLTLLYFAQNSFFASLILALLIASQLHTFTVLQHDCGHKAAFRSEHTNLWVGRFFAWFIFMPFTVFTELHRRHHAHLGDPDRDPDEWFYASGKKWLFIRECLFMPRFIWLSLSGNLSAPIKKRIMQELIFNGITLALIVYLLWMNGLSSIALYGILLPMFLLATVINPISRGYEHYPMANMDRTDLRRKDLRFNTITVKNRFIGLVWANINYHVEHHLYPRIPFYRLPYMHRLLRNKNYIIRSFVLQNID